jgi:hypothetical protein
MVKIIKLHNEEEPCPFDQEPCPFDNEEEPCPFDK